MSMKEIFYRALTCIAMLLTVALLSGCAYSEFLANKRPNSKKIEGYDQKISSPGVMWQTNPDLYLEIKKTSTSGSYVQITAGEKADSRDSLGALLRITSTQATRVLSTRLNAKGVLATTLASDASSVANSTQYVIRVRPDFAESQCYTQFCLHNVGLLVNVVDLTLKKSVWQGAFKVGTVTSQTAKESELDRFADSVIIELQKANLI